MAGPLVLVVEVLAWWAATVGVWLISLSAVSDSELIVAVASGLPCALAATAGRRAVRGRWSLRPGLLRPLLLLPAAIVTDAAQVLVAPLRPRRPVRGRFRTIELGAAAGPSAAAAGSRAAGTWLVSATPGTFVVDVDPDDGTALVHALTEHGPRMERAVSR